MPKRTSWQVVLPSVGLIAGVLAGPALARDEYTRDFDRSGNLSNGQRVRVQHRLGGIEIRAHSGQEVRVHAVVKASGASRDDAKRYAESIRIDVEPSAGAMLIETVYPKTDTLPWFRNISYSVDYVLEIPESSPLEVNNAFGALRVNGIRAGGTLITSHGRLELRDAQGPQHVENSFSEVVVERNQGDLTVANTNGNVEISDVKGSVHVRNRFGRVALTRTGGGVVNNGNGVVQLEQIGGDMRVTTSFAAVTAVDVKGGLSVNNQNGAVRVERIAGNAEIATSFAKIDFSEIGGALTVKSQNGGVEGRGVSGPVNIQTSFAAVNLQDAKKGARVISQNGSVTFQRVAEDVYVKTSFAPVKLEMTGGAVEVANQNGAVEMALARAGACRPVTVETSFAPIRIRTGSDPDFAVTARTSFAKIHSEFPMMVSGFMSDDSVSGTIGRGACPMRLKDQNGSIDILR
ncbi:MAG: hypothetical protein JO022_04940 [Acidobacteriaceae bacterium]|nr:hypothetical protein [Acidobacteriaceae bacterium]